PGPAGIGVVVTGPDGRVLARRGRGIGVATNNVAEYRAAIEGLRLARSLGASRVLLRSDSHLLVQQLTGRWRVKDPTLARLHGEAMGLARGFEAVSFEHVPRELNREADRLANRGVDAWLAGPGRGYRPPGPEPRLFEPGGDQAPGPRRRSPGAGPGPGRGRGSPSLY
ncbi:MAG TPA: ribonuclease HI family protein, partial [Actinomycetota bacterium]|nr:ribonuclease HI family protein [Actinomycetota bacterium]